MVPIRSPKLTQAGSLTARNCLPAKSITLSGILIFRVLDSGSGAAVLAATSFGTASARGAGRFP